MIPFLRGEVEACLLSASGLCLLQGWVADAGREPATLEIGRGDVGHRLPSTALFRTARHDVPASPRGAPGVDAGFVAFARLPPALRDGAGLELRIASGSAKLVVELDPAPTPGRHVLDLLLDAVATMESFAGRDISIAEFLRGEGGATALDAFREHVARHDSSFYVERFRPRPVRQSFVTVLFGTTGPLRLQPPLFLEAGVALEACEWIFVCNSPELGEECLRLGRLMSDLYDLTLTVILMGDNVGFGAANNVAVQQAASARIALINPDVFPLPGTGEVLGRLAAQRGSGAVLWGGLLFYDEHTLMHSGMYLVRDTLVRRHPVGGEGLAPASSWLGLLRVEHFDKGTPFFPAAWTHPRTVPAVTGAFMLLNRASFEKIGGFSRDYIYGHYEDADLSLRWAREVGYVAVHPQLRFVHLEGQGARPRGPHYGGAALANRHIFTGRYLDSFETNPVPFTETTHATLLSPS